MREPYLKVDNIPLENVEHFKYLGSIKSQNSSCSKDIAARISMRKNRLVQLTNIWKSHNIPNSLIIKLLEYIVWPVLLYVSEAWAQKRPMMPKLKQVKCGFIVVVIPYLTKF